MNRHVMRIARATALIAVVTTGAAQAADRPDSWVTMKTKVSLLTTEGISTRALNVDTVHGVVTLHGQVPNQAEKMKAEDVARHIDGVKKVKNLLQVVPAAARKVVDRSDDAIKKSLDAAFKANSRVHKSGIDVQSVNKGVVLLAGKTKSMAAELEAVQVAHAVSGVKRVASEVQVEPAS